MYYIVSTIPIINTISDEGCINLIISFKKDVKLEELIECKLTISINLNNDLVLSHDSIIKFVENDQIIDVYTIKDHIETLLNSLISTLKAIDQGINTIPEFYINDNLLSNDSISVRSILKNSIKLITNPILHSVAVQVYYVLVDYKGSDTLQMRKQIQMYKMMESAKGYY